MRSVRGMELDARGGELTLNMDGEEKTRKKKVDLNVKRSSCVRIMRFGSNDSSIFRFFLRLYGDLIFRKRDKEK